MKNVYNNLEYQLGILGVLIIGIIAVIMKNINNPIVIMTYNLGWFFIGFSGMLFLTYISNKYNKR